MPQTPHVEKHFTAGEVVRDIVIGMSDGLTVPFALAAGLTGAIINTHLIVVAGLAEISAGSIAMGLGGYLAARSDREHYQSERVREVSAGGVVLRKMRGIWHIAAIEPQIRNDDPNEITDVPNSEVPKEPKPTRVKPPVIALPKGAVDPGEKP